MRPPFTVVVCTCDAYEDLWPPLFQLFKRYWPSLDAAVVLNTETKQFEVPGIDIVSPRLYCATVAEGTPPWSQRLRRHLVEVVETEFVLLYLDDFFLRSPVDESRLDICIEFLAANPQLTNIQLFSPAGAYWPTSEHPWIVRRDRRSPYLLSLQAGLWRRSNLLRVLRDHESPWQFERWGSVRARRMGGEFYAAVPVAGRQAVFDYDPTESGITAGRWRAGTPEFFRTHQIDVDVLKRGVLPPGWMPAARRRKLLPAAWAVWKSLKP